MLHIRALVVTWQAAHLLPPCLDSLLSQEIPGAQIEVVVVDNASTDGTGELLGRDYPTLRVIASSRNLGFAGGVALGTADFAGDVVLLLNNDAVLEPGAAAELVSHLTALGAERVAAATARILLAGRYRRTTTLTTGSPDGHSLWEPTDDPNGVTLVNSTGNVITRNGAGADRDWLVPADQEHSPAEVFGFCGGAAALRWSAVRAVGGIDAELFLYYEDTDLSWKLRAHGWETRYVHHAVAWHRHAASTDANSPLFRFYNSRNSLIVVTRHAPPVMVLRSWARQIAGLLRAMLHDGLSPHTRARARGIGAALRRMPRTLTERRRLWSDAIRTRSEATGHDGT